MPERLRRPVARSSRDRILRYAGLAVGLLIGYAIGHDVGELQDDVHPAGLGVLLGTLLGGLFFIIAPYVTVGFFNWLRRKLSSIPPIDIVAAGIGLIIGGILSSLLAFPMWLLPDPLGQIMPFVVAVSVSVLSVFVMLVQKDELLPLIIRRSPSLQPQDKLLLDTSVIIDGRIVELVRTGIVNYPLVVPRFILRELQSVADSDDPGRKARGRRGIDVLEQLQREQGAVIEIAEIEVLEESHVDNKLIRLAKLSHYQILTGDQNLERIAKLQQVPAININSVANALRPPVAPGEEIDLEIVQPGREIGQGIGYLADGTLVVVEEGRARIGEHVRVVVTRTLQTGTGRMAFAQVKEEIPA